MKFFGDGGPGGRLILFKGVSVLSFGNYEQGIQHPETIFIKVLDEPSEDSLPRRAPTLPGELLDGVECRGDDLALAHLLEQSLYESFP